MGTAVSSAYGKAKSAITTPFTGETAAPETASNLSTKPTIGPELYVMNGQLHESQGNYNKAIDSYSKALEIEPKNPAALLSTARLYDRQNEKDKSVEFYQKAAEVTPNDANIYAELGALHAKTGNLTAAREQMQKAVNLDPKSTTYRSSMAGVLLDSGNTESAMAELMQVNTPAMANYQMAYLHFARKNVPATQQYLNSALQIDPNLKPARDLMASMGGAQNISQMAQQGQTMMQQAQGIYQQAGAIGSNVQGLISAAPAQPAGFSTPVNQSNSFLPPPASPPSSSQGVPLQQPAGSVPSFESAGKQTLPVRR
jgi:tetratricopeptide (TPR) repeat protein